jgi:hypothetical protein
MRCRFAKSKVKYHRRLSAFFNEMFPQIKLATELEKEILIRDLAKSPSFKATRRTLRGLSKFDDLTADQVAEILEAAINNNQIYWIAEDPRIRSTLVRLLTPHRSELDEERLEEFDRLYVEENAPVIPESVPERLPDPFANAFSDLHDEADAPQSNPGFDDDEDESPF